MSELSEAVERHNQRQQERDICIPLCIGSILNSMLNVECSTDMIYSLREPNGITGEVDRGMSCADALDKLMRIGCWTSVDYMNWAQEQQQQDADIQREILAQECLTLKRPVVRVISFRRLVSLDELRQHNTHGKSILITPFYNTSAEFWRPTRWQLMKYLLRTRQRCTEQILRQVETDYKLLPPPTRFHATIVVGETEDRQGFRLRNCWGSGWADGGCSTFPLADFAKYAVEAFVIDDARVFRASTSTAHE